MYLAINDGEMGDVYYFSQLLPCIALNFPLLIISIIIFRKWKQINFKYKQTILLLLILISFFPLILYIGKWLI